MEEGVLFEVRKENLETGLRGIPVGYCTTSHVDPQKGLFYVGRAVSDLQGWRAEDVIYLLYKGAPGTKEEVRVFQEELARRSSCSEEVQAAVRALPRKGHPMDLFAAAILLLGAIEGVGDYKEDALSLIAKLPSLAAMVINHHAGWGPTPSRDGSLGYMENFLHMLQSPGKKTAELLEVLRLFEVLSFDHGGGNLSTFVGKAVASGLENLHGSIAAAMTALAGPRHGRANQDCLEFVAALSKELGDRPTEAMVERALREKLSKKELLFGFGHAVLRVEDPRATVCYQYCQKHFSSHPLVQMALLLRTAGPKVLQENPKISNPYPNVDAITGTMLFAAGFSRPEYFTILFGMSRSVGIAIQILYERLEARGGKGTPIVRPAYLYKAR